MALEATARWLDRQAARLLPRKAPPPWAWPALLVALGAGAVGAGLLWSPTGTEQLTVLGRAWGSECGMQAALGIPCPQCGMTRSWVWMARGEWTRAFTYNAAGATLWLWLLVAGSIGAVRLVTRDWKRLRPPWPLLMGWTLTWAGVLYALLWVLRAFAGVNPLP